MGHYYVFQAPARRASNIWVLPEHFITIAEMSSHPVQLTTGLFLHCLRFQARMVRSSSSSERNSAPSWSGTISSLASLSVSRGISAGELDFHAIANGSLHVSYPDDTLWRSKPDGSERLQLTYPPSARQLLTGLPMARPSPSPQPHRKTLESFRHLPRWRLAGAITSTETLETIPLGPQTAPRWPSAVTTISIRKTCLSNWLT